MFTWETALVNATVSGTAVAGLGTVLGVNPYWILLGVSVAGSLASVGFRWMNGHLKDWKQRAMAFACGIMLSLVAIPYMEARGVEGLEAAIFVLFISLIGARIIKYMTTDFDVVKFVSGVIKRLLGGQ